MENMKCESFPAANHLHEQIYEIDPYAWHDAADAYDEELLRVGGWCVYPETDRPWGRPWDCNLEMDNPYIDIPF